MNKRTKIILLAITSGLVSLGVNVGMDYWNEKEADYPWYIFNFFLWLAIGALSAYLVIKEAEEGS
ncbi:MAG: hypothetical protein CMP59_09145 [Flavobacteriales bacterium]|nr:hypothetical protein [Flavobacteriales bacterium]|tara:strand:+ start:257 stop:451 length:195 start_codon:yes stop_codon:yes gene_type:complete